MTELLPFLKSMLSVSGLSGDESPIASLIQEAWKPLVNEISLSRLGSLHGLRYGIAPLPRPRLILSTHMDAIGLMVTGAVDGFLRITEVGGVDARILPGQPVIIHGIVALPGVVVQPPSRLLPEAYKDDPVGIEYLWVDTGLEPADVAEKVRVGDQVSFAQVPIDLAGNAICGHSLDNRASVAAATVCLQGLQQRAHAWDVWAVASVQEEETLGGALTSPFEIRPDLAIVVDVTFAKGPGSSDYGAFPLGKGVSLGIGPNCHPALYKTMKELAEKLEIPIHIDVMPQMSGTDAMGIQIVAEGIPCVVLGIPLRYMHTPVEVVSLKDIERSGRLMAEFIAQLEPDYIEKITWDD
ncbi:MAG TPA: M42 family metallopeptidase [Anaerolineaceae bacterium]|jgi:tetrahedral aminopeptidase